MHSQLSIFYVRKDMILILLWFSFFHRHSSYKHAWTSVICNAFVLFSLLFSLLFVSLSNILLYHYISYLISNLILFYTLHTKYHYILFNASYDLLCQQNIVQVLSASEPFYTKYTNRLKAHLKELSQHTERYGTKDTQSSSEQLICRRSIEHRLHFILHAHSKQGVYIT